MISAPSSHALLARTALRGARMAAAAKPARIASAVLVSSSASQPSRSLTTSSIAREEVAAPATIAVETDNTATTTTTTAKFVDYAEPTSYATSGRKKRGKPTTEADKAKLLLKWGWFEPRAPELGELASALKRESRFPEWLKSTYDEVKSFRSARARLWIPTAEEIQASVGSDVTVTDAQQWIEQQIEAHRNKLAKASKSIQKQYDMMDYEQQVDFVLRSVWKSMSEEQRSAALLRSRYESIRKLGWRQGYSSGYPRPEGESSHLPDKLGAKGDEGWAAFRELQKAEEKEAWLAWQNLSAAERVAEEKAAWKLRDRSQVYLDDSEDSLILGSPSPRWYREPERAGELTFLPNTVVKLVKNHTPEGQEYDAFKATFRVPLSMHKHALRSYLLSIYGLKTTWARSSIYRSPVTRDNRTGKVITGRGRTYKKVEVGLLEPFLFPEVSPEFQKQHLLTSELDYERSRVYLKMTKTTRWRGKKSTEQYENEVANRDAGLYHGLDPHASEGIKGGAKEEGERFPRFMVKTKGLPSAKHGKILQLLGQERAEKEARVNALIEQYKRDAAQAGNS